MLGGPRDQEAPRAGHLQRDARPVGEADRLVDAAPGEPGAQLVGLDGLEQAGRAAGCLRARRVSLHDDDRLAGQRAVQGRAEAERAGPDDDNVSVHLASVPPPR